jgi:Zn-finger nucleic acid-binding protein
MFPSSASMQVKISLRRKFPNDLADCPRCRARNISPGYLELLLRKTRSYETLPKEVFLKLFEPKREHSGKHRTNKDCTKNMTAMITANVLISTTV